MMVSCLGLTDDWTQSWQGCLLYSLYSLYLYTCTLSRCTGRILSIYGATDSDGSHQ